MHIVYWLLNQPGENGNLCTKNYHSGGAEIKAKKKQESIWNTIYWLALELWLMRRFKKMELLWNEDWMQIEIEFNCSIWDIFPLVIGWLWQGSFFWERNQLQLLAAQKDLPKISEVLDFRKKAILLCTMNIFLKLFVTYCLHSGEILLVRKKNLIINFSAVFSNEIYSKSNYWLCFAGEEGGGQRGRERK